MNKPNYHLQMMNIIQDFEQALPKKSLLLHICCAPCASYCLELLTQYFDITLLYYNPNISDIEEYELRKKEVLRLVDFYQGKVKYLDTGWQNDDFVKIAKGYEHCVEGGERCARCYQLRLDYTARVCKEMGFDYFASTLSISPHKNSLLLNKIGEQCGAQYGVVHLPNDFKKNEGYKRSCVLSEQFGFYRQDYCGCEFSKRESMERANNCPAQNN